MESISSRYLHRKLSNNVLSAKDAYDDVFGGRTSKVSSGRIDEDYYKEIFSSSRVSSIPVLDLPLHNDTNAPSADDNYRTKKIDYSNIFGGGGGGDDTVSYRQLLTNHTKITHTKTSSGTPSAKRFHLQNPDRLSKDNKVFSPEASYQSLDNKKQFNMSYNKTSIGSNDGENGTRHVAQFHHVPGFTCFVDETAPQKTAADKPYPLPKNDNSSEVDLGGGISEGRNAKAALNIANKQTCGREVKSRSGFSSDASYSNDELFNAHDPDLKSHPLKVQPPSSMASNLKNTNGDSKRFSAGNNMAPRSDAAEHAAGDCSPPLFGEELDVNSAAAASAAVLRNAILKAQESIRIAKEMMEKKKEGLRSCASRSFKDRLKVADRRENIILQQGSRTEDNNAKDTSGSEDSVNQVFSGMRKKMALRSGEVVSDFKDTERTSFEGKVIGDEHSKNLQAAETCEPGIRSSSPMSIGKQKTAKSSTEWASSKSEVGQLMDKHECNVKEMNINIGTLKQHEVVQKEKADEKVLEVQHIERIPTNFTIEHEPEDDVNKLAADCVVHKHGVQSGISQYDDGSTQQTGFYGNEDCEKKPESQQKIEDEREFEAHKLMEDDSKKRPDKAQEPEEHAYGQKEFSREEHIEKRREAVEKRREAVEKRREDVEKEEHDLKLKRMSDEDIDENGFEDAFQWGENDSELKEAWGSESNEKKEQDIYMGEDTECKPDDIYELKIEDETANNVQEGKESDELSEEFEPKYIVMEPEKIVIQEAQYDENYRKARKTWKHNLSKCISEIRENCQTEVSESLSSQDLNESKTGATEDFCDFKMVDAEEFKLRFKLEEEEIHRTDSLNQGVAKDDGTGNSVNVFFEVLPSEVSAPKIGSINNMDFRKKEFAKREKENELDPNLDSCIERLANGSMKRRIEILANGSTKTEVIFEEEVTRNDEELQNSAGTSNGEQRCIEVMVEFETSNRLRVSKEEEKTITVDEDITKRGNTERNEEKFPKTIAMEGRKGMAGEEIKTSLGKEVNNEHPNEGFAVEEKETRKAVPKGVEEKVEYLRRIEEANRREREREKDKIVVERAIREARERAFAGQRERAERAAVEKATAEVRHRAMAEARGKLEKANAATKSLAEKAAVEAKLRAERAAVERATAEARERALEKALSQKATSRAQAEAFVSEKFSVPPRDGAMKKSMSSSDLQKSDETNHESAQRSKARLERHERIMERAAKALAEKNKRDLLAQKEQAEKNRLSESLDADIRRWSNGKEGNLRALLSTLQYILGPGSGWQPVSLTDIVTNSAVKKAYRKATLYVHPDKLQQRGASIQQKYICEKVFELLKVAYNRFNVEEK